MVTACSLCVAVQEAKVEEVIFIVYGMSVCAKHIQTASECRDYNLAVYTLRKNKES